MDMNVVAGAMLLMGGTGVVLGIVIALFARFFKTPSDARADLAMAVTSLEADISEPGKLRLKSPTYSKSITTGKIQKISQWKWMIWFHHTSMQNLMKFWAEY